MQYTPNYNLITVEGTDVVNPLVQMNPNFTDIDAAMFANKQAVIGTATEITAGTVHSITRANADSNYFRFTATSNWTLGDSMSVDGVAVSVFLTDGTIPGTGSYVINSEVFGMISGTRVTLFLANPEVNRIGDLADLATTDKSSIVNAINEVYGMASGPSSVSVTADGVATNAQIISDLYALVDMSLVTTKATLSVTSGTNTSIYDLEYKGANVLRFGSSRCSGSVVFVTTYVASTTSAAYASNNGTITDNSASVPTSGVVFTIYY